MKKNRAPFRVGDLVVSDYYDDQRQIVRKITCIYRDSHFGSGWGANADCGKPCPTCHRAGWRILAVDASWFKAAPNEGGK